MIHCSVGHLNRCVCLAAARIFGCLIVVCLGMDGAGRLPSLQAQDEGEQSWSAPTHTVSMPVPLQSAHPVDRNPFGGARTQQTRPPQQFNTNNPYARDVKLGTGSTANAGAQSGAHNSGSKALGSRNPFGGTAHTVAAPPGPRGQSKTPTHHGVAASNSQGTSQGMGTSKGTGNTGNGATSKPTGISSPTHTQPFHQSSNLPTQPRGRSVSNPFDVTPLLTSGKKQDERTQFRYALRPRTFRPHVLFCGVVSRPRCILP